MKKYLIALAMAAAGAAALISSSVQAGSYCVQDPPRPTASVGLYVAQQSSSMVNKTTDNSYRLYDAKGDEFRIHGVNHNHWDSTNAYAGIPTTGANTVRIVMKGSLNGTTLTTTPADAVYTSAMIDKFLAAGLVPIVGDWRGTCKAKTAPFDYAVQSWISNAPVFAKYDGKVIWNIANEWGPVAGTSAYSSALNKNVYTPNYTWRDKSISGVQAMRAAGYRGLIMIDAGSCGQDATTVYRDGGAVLAADPLKNVIFDVHVYGGFHYPATASWQQDYTTAMYNLKASGLPLVIGEFGPGRNVGPSPTLIPPQTVINTAEANGWGWIAWAYGDNNLSGCQSNDLGFSMTINCGIFTGATDPVTGKYTELTQFGNDVVPLFRSLMTKKAALQ